MASITLSNVVSGSAHGACEGERRKSVSRSLTCQGIQKNAFLGLRTINNVDSLRSSRLSKSNLPRALKKETRSSGSKNPGAIVCSGGKNIVFVSTEVGPWSKTGGLGDVVGGLPPALAKLGHRVMTVSPRYDQYKDAWDTSVLLELQVAGKSHTVRFFHCRKKGVDRVFIDHPLFLEKVWGQTGGKLYGPVAGEDYQDNQTRFMLLSLAALEAPRILNLKSSGSDVGPYGEDVVFVCNDWHTAILPCYLKTLYKPHGIYKNAKVAFCIHNIAYQGRFPPSDFSSLGLPDSLKSSFDFMDGYLKPVKGRKINWLRAGIIESDLVLTVSRYYAEELVSGVAKGVELHREIAAANIVGIENGMDVEVWNPATDKFISAKYDAKTVLEAKPLNKEDVQASLGLPVDPSAILLAFIGRLEEQKGSDILVEAIPKFLAKNIQMVVLGTGKKAMEKQAKAIEEAYPDNVRAVAKFDPVLAHKLFAGADLMIIPSRFEPCGIVQLQAMNFGTPSLVTSTGGLVNTVVDGVTGFHMGAFNIDCDAVDPADVEAIVTAVEQAAEVYGTAQFEGIIQNCMAQDLSWEKPAEKWEQVLVKLINSEEETKAATASEELVTTAVTAVTASA
ncbi:UDP-Glycosyltransferase superfamily protein [Wolffia australiana]